MKRQSSLLLLSAFITSAAIGVYADSERYVIGNVALCIPKNNIARADYPWIPRDLPRGGINFVLPIEFYRQYPDIHPILDIGGQPSPLYGSIDLSRTYQNWKRPLPGSVPYERAADPQAITETLHKSSLVAVYATSAKEQWVVWRVPAPSDAFAGKIPVLGEVVAVCRRPSLQRNDMPSAICTRVAPWDGLAIAFAINPEDLRSIEAVDKAVRDRINRWKC